MTLVLGSQAYHRGCGSSAELPQGIFSVTKGGFVALLPTGFVNSEGEEIYCIKTNVYKY